MVAPTVDAATRSIRLRASIPNQKEHLRPGMFALAVVGFGFITQMAGTMTLLQGLAPAEMRGRVMGLFSTLFVGVTPFGSLLAGLVAHRAGTPRTLVAGGAAVLLASLAFHVALPRLRKVVLAEHPTLFPPVAS